MHDTNDTNASSTSPTTTWKWAKIRSTPARPTARRPKGSSPALSKRNPRDTLSLTVKLRGGPECWWEITARGRVFRRPGHLALHDVLMDVVDGRGGKPL